MEDFASGDLPEDARDAHHPRPESRAAAPGTARSPTSRTRSGSNPLHPVYAQGPLPSASATAPPISWVDYPGGLVEIGYQGDAFCFDNETPRHKVYLEPFRLASRPVTCAEYLRIHGRRRLCATPSSGSPRAGPPSRPNAGRPRSTGVANRDSGTVAGLHPARSRAARRFAAHARLPHQLFRGRSLRALGRQTSAHRSRMGNRRRQRSCRRQSARRRRFSTRSPPNLHHR